MKFLIWEKIKLLLLFIFIIKYVHYFISSRLEDFFYYYYYFSTAFQALILFHAYNVMFWLACGIMYYLPVCCLQFLLQLWSKGIPFWKKLFPLLGRDQLNNQGIVITINFSRLRWWFSFTKENWSLPEKLNDFWFPPSLR